MSEAKDEVNSRRIIGVRSMRIRMRSCSESAAYQSGRILSSTYASPGKLARSRCSCLIDCMILREDMFCSFVIGWFAWRMSEACACASPLTLLQLLAVETC